MTESSVDNSRWFSHQHNAQYADDTTLILSTTATGKRHLGVSNLGVLQLVSLRGIRPPRQRGVVLPDALHRLGIT
jgi:hypothetical protein